MIDCSNFKFMGIRRNIPWALLVLLLLLWCMASCKSDKAKWSDLADEKHQIFFDNAIYHWKNTFNPTDEELEFLKKHYVECIYVRLYDVVENGRENLRLISRH